MKTSVLAYMYEILILVSVHIYFYGFVQDCSNSIGNTLELLQSSTKQLIYDFSCNN